MPFRHRCPFGTALRTTKPLHEDFGYICSDLGSQKHLLRPGPGERGIRSHEGHPVSPIECQLAAWRGSFSQCCLRSNDGRPFEEPRCKAGGRWQWRWRWRWRWQRRWRWSSLSGELHPVSPQPGGEQAYEQTSIVWQSTTGYRLYDLRSGEEAIECLFLTRVARTLPSMWGDQYQRLPMTWCIRQKWVLVLLLTLVCFLVPSGWKVVRKARDATQRGSHGTHSRA